MPSIKLFELGPKGLRLAEMLGNGPLGWEEQRRHWFSVLN